MKKRTLLFGLVATFVLAASCAIENFNTVPNLNTPLALGAVYTTNFETNINGSVTNFLTNGVIRLQFWGFNNENFFSGYEIFLAESLSDLTNETGSYRVIPNINGETNSGDSNDLTLMTTLMLKATLFSFDAYYDTNMSTLNNGTYYFWVRAYSYTFGNYSLPSNWTNADYTSI